MESGAAKGLQETMYCLLSMVSTKIQVTVPSAITNAVITGFCPLKNLVFHCRKSMNKIIVRGAEGNHWQKVMSIVWIFSYEVLIWQSKNPDQFDISVNVRYSSVTKNESKQNESIAQLPTESQRCTEKVVLRTLQYRNKLLRQKYNWVLKREQVLPLKAFFCRKTVPDHLTAPLILIPRIRIPDPGPVIPDSPPAPPIFCLLSLIPYNSLRPWSSPIFVKQRELE